MQVIKMEAEKEMEPSGNLNLIDESRELQISFDDDTLAPLIHYKAE